jgi:transmembrane sensor
LHLQDWLSGMSNEETAREIDESAAEWAVKRETRGNDPVFAAELNAWLAQDPRRAGALLRAEAALSYLNRGRALSTADSHATAIPRISRRSLLLGGAISSMAAGLGAIAVWWPSAETYQTAVGEVRKLPLPDGSVATINTGSELQVAMTPSTRRLSLIQGEAWFKVASNPERPFVVEAGQVRVRAVGTAFSVRRRETGASVFVTEGVVETWIEGQENLRTKVAAGSKALVEPGQPPQAVEARQEIEHGLAWRFGQISLYGETLATAVNEFNRYNTRKIVIGDAELATEKVVGQFSADDPEAFARAAAGMFGARLITDDSTLRLYREPPTR